ncbi:MAG: DNA-directed RNA polymerase subunit RpoH/Rpb5 C-terminal domain-containing protein [Candidatus Micrarchaeales archaeon]
MVAPRELIPEHKLLSESEAKKVAKLFGIPFEKFPFIFESDPQAAKLGAKSGHLIEIDRVDPTGKYKYYRYVVKG